MLTDRQLNEIEARARAATEGPWGVYCGHYRDRDFDFYVESNAEAIWDDKGSCGEADAQFIAAARTDMPLLVAELRDARADRAAMLKVCLRLVEVDGADPRKFGRCSYCNGLPCADNCPVNLARAAIARATGAA